MGQFSDEIDNPQRPLRLSPGGRNWRWLRGTVPPICTRCYNAPSVAQYGNFPVCWDCLLVKAMEGPVESEEDE